MCTQALKDTSGCRLQSTAAKSVAMVETTGTAKSNNKKNPFLFGKAKKPF